MVTVQRFPEGILPLLQLQTAGIPPQVLQQAVNLGIDGLPFYSAAADVSAVGTAVALAAAGSFGQSLTVPAGEFWLVHHASVRWAATAGTASGVRPAWYLRRNGNNVYLPGAVDSAMTLAGIGVALAWVWQPTRLILLRPGDGFWVEQTSSPDPISGQVAVLHTRLVA